jgi:hypothetical protein
MYLLIIGWLYVALMMAIAEAMNPAGTVLGALITFVLYGAAPVALMTYLLSTPARKRAARRRQAAESGGDADRGGKAPADPVAPVREEP